MRVFPCAKINLGLNIVSKRTDGYHNLETVFYPVGIHDTLDIVEAKETSLTTDSVLRQEDPERNLVMRAYRLLEREYGLPPVHITLQKHIPMQAGMGGGSSDCAFTLRLLNELFSLNIPVLQLREYAATLGADCAFFIEARPAYAEGIGEVLAPIELDLSGWQLAVVKPGTAVSTKEAFAHITPRKPAENCRDIVSHPIETWRGRLTNDFEQSIFPLHPEIASIRQCLYEQGAVYAAMSGSGSSVFGIFHEKPRLDFGDCYTTLLNL